MGPFPGASVERASSGGSFFLWFPMRSVGSPNSDVCGLRFSISPGLCRQLVRRVCRRTSGVVLFQWIVSGGIRGGTLSRRSDTFFRFGISKVGLHTAIPLGKLTSNLTRNLNFVHPFPNGTLIFPTRITMSDNLTRLQTPRIRIASSIASNGKGNLNSNLISRLPISIFQTRDLGLSNFQVSTTSNVNGKRFTTITRTNDRSILNRVTNRVNNTTISFNHVFSQGNPTTIFNRNPVNVSRSFPTYRTHVARETTSSRATYLVSTSDHVQTCPKATSQFSSHLLRGLARIVLPSNLTILDQRSRTVSASEVPFIVGTRHSLQFPIEPRRPPRYYIVTCPIRATSRPLDRISHRKRMVNHLVHHVTVRSTLITATSSTIPFDLNRTLFSIVQLLVSVNRSRTNVNYRSRHQVNVTSINGSFSNRNHRVSNHQQQGLANRNRSVTKGGNFSDRVEDQILNRMDVSSNIKGLIAGLVKVTFNRNFQYRVHMVTISRIVSSWEEPINACQPVGCVSYSGHTTFLPCVIWGSYEGG